MKKATRQQIKQHNTRLVLRSIYNQEGISRADLSRTTKLTKTTVSGIVAELMQKRLVEEFGYASSHGGKPAILLRVVDSARYYLGIDLANSVFRGAVVNLRGEIINQTNLQVNDRNGEAALALVFDLIDQLLAEPYIPISGIGIGTPGLVDPFRGVILQAVNLNWQELPLKRLVEERYNLPCSLANDCQAAALGEYTFANRNNSSHLIVVKVGRGIGSGIIINGNLYYGDGYGAGEIGHLGMVEDGERCTCGNRGCLETVASSRALVHRAREIAQNNPDSLLNRFSQKTQDINTEIVLDAFYLGDPVLQGLVEDAGNYLGKALAGLVSVLNITHIVIAGSMARFNGLYIDSIKQGMLRNSMSFLAEKTQVGFSALGQDIVIKGAASLLLANELHPV